MISLHPRVWFTATADGLTVQCSKCGELDGDQVDTWDEAVKACADHKNSHEPPSVTAGTGSLVLGVDPGSKSTGLIVRTGAQLVSHALVRRPDHADRAEWIDMCLTDALNLIKPIQGVDLVAVEDVTTPNVWHHGRKQSLDPTSLIETAAIAGAFIGWAWADRTAAVLVPPGHNGSGHRSQYPTDLWGPRETDKGTGVLRHCRSAWDVAIAGERIRQARRIA